jgi:cell wall-associated NlpC family hydrolase
MEFIKQSEEKFENTEESEMSDEINKSVLEEKKLEEMLISEKREQIISEAMKCIWRQYMRRQANPKNWFDCSGFINYILCKVFNKHTSQIPRSTKTIFQQYWRFRVMPDFAKDGDIVLFLNKSWVPYHGEILTNYDKQKKEISCIGSASRSEKSPNWTFYKPWVNKRTREYNEQKYLIIDVKKIMHLW